MARYLLACACGRQLEVDAGQAGETLVCECGASVAVPTLRQLRQLPLAATSEPAAGTPAWGVRQGAIVVGLIAAGVCLAVAGWSRFTEPTLPEFDSAAWDRFVEQDTAQLSPAEAWQRWIDVYQPLAESGFTPLEHPETAPRRQMIDQHRLLQTVMVAAAAICGAAVAAFWISARRASPTRRGGRPTRPHVTSPHTG